MAETDDAPARAQAQVAAVVALCKRAMRLPTLEDPRPADDRVSPRAVLAAIEAAGSDDAAVEALVNQAAVRGLTVQGGRAELEVVPPHELAVEWVRAARGMLADAPNYAETTVAFPEETVSMEVGAAGEPDRYILTVQRAGKLTPHQARRQAEAALAEAWAALPDSVSGDAAPEGTTLAERIMALTAERDHRHNGWAGTMKRVRVLRAQVAAVRELCTPALKLPRNGMVRASDLLDAMKTAETAPAADSDAQVQAVRALCEDIRAQRAPLTSDPLVTTGAVLAAIENAGASDG